MIKIQVFNGDTERWASFVLFQQTVEKMTPERAQMYNGATFEQNGKQYEIRIKYCPTAKKILK